MTLLRHRPTCAALAIAFSMIAAAPRESHANWEGAIASPTTFFARWSFVPDFDQRRLNLTGNGAMYCVPTSYMNWIAYIARHGYPGVNPPGDQTIYYWHSDTPFIDMTGWLFDLGVLMQTHGTEGTKANAAVDGFIDWMDGKGFPYYIYRYGVSEDFTPRHGHISEWTLYKCPVIMGIGWYSNNVLPPGFPSDLTLIVREGGHAVSLVEVARSGNDREVGFRDPASDNSNQPLGIAFQSPATTESYAVLAEQIYLDGFGPRVMDKIDGYGSGWLDGYTVIIPLSALTTVDDRLKLGIFTPNPWSWDEAPPLQEIDIGSPTQIADVRNIPGTPEACVLTEPDMVGGKVPSKVWRVNLVTGDAVEIGSFNDAKRIVLGRRRQLYVLDGSTVRAINIGVDPPVETNTVGIGGSPDALAYRDFDDSVLIHSPGAKRVFILDESLSETANPILDLPPDEVVLDGETFIATLPDSAAMLLTSETSPAVYMVTQTAGEPIVVPALEGVISAPQSLNIGDDGTMYISENGLLRVYPPDPIDGGWLDEDLTSPFAGLATNGPIEIPCSRSNTDLPDPSDPAFFNVLPTEHAVGVVDCIHLDADASGLVDFGDITMVLANWLSDYTPGTGPGDADADGEVDFGDVTTILGNWLAPCP